MSRYEDLKVCGMYEELFIKLKVNVLVNEILISFIFSLIQFYNT